MSASDAATLLPAKQDARTAVPRVEALGDDITQLIRDSFALDEMNFGSSESRDRERYRRARNRSHHRQNAAHSYSTSGSPGNTSEEYFEHDSPYDNARYENEYGEPLTFRDICMRALQRATAAPPVLEPLSRPKLAVDWLHQTLPLTDEQPKRGVKFCGAHAGAGLSETLGQYYSDLGMLDLRFLVHRILKDCNVAYALADRRIVQASRLANVLRDYGLPARSEVMNIICSNLVWCERNYVCLGKLARLAGPIDPNLAEEDSYVRDLSLRALAEHQELREAQRQANDSALADRYSPAVLRAIGSPAAAMRRHLLEPEYFSEPTLQQLEMCHTDLVQNRGALRDLLYEIRAVTGASTLQNFEALAAFYAEEELPLSQMPFSQFLDALLRDTRGIEAVPVPLIEWKTEAEQAALSPAKSGTSRPRPAKSTSAAPATDLRENTSIPSHNAPRRSSSFLKPRAHQVAAPRNVFHCDDSLPADAQDSRQVTAEVRYDHSSERKPSDAGITLRDETFATIRAMLRSEMDLYAMPSDQLKQFVRDFALVCAKRWLTANQVQQLFTAWKIVGKTNVRRLLTAYQGKEYLSQTTVYEALLSALSERAR